MHLDTKILALILRRIDVYVYCRYNRYPISVYAECCCVVPHITPTYSMDSSCRCYSRTVHNLPSPHHTNLAICNNLCTFPQLSPVFVLQLSFCSLHHSLSLILCQFIPRSDTFDVQLAEYPHQYSCHDGIACLFV